MENNLVHIAISPHVLAALIESGTIHAVDFKCLDINSKKTVWKLFLFSVKLTKKNQFRYQENSYV
ncbi:hypothetical protein MGMO_103c00190 [Methyloglobulus morosus KoM1]|uniref:Uncharacterized protein n=1 Tax=Methyloglobulus morosus KoM1 TaxID=1116472 RepID=V5BYX0_9GAMM|nr:hypothetical protein MGMO_103c00190 [Methyloglobulus morosus KoM1]